MITNFQPNCTYPNCTDSAWKDGLCARHYLEMKVLNAQKNAGINTATGTAGWVSSSNVMQPFPMNPVNLAEEAEKWVAEMKVIGHHDLIDYRTCTIKGLLELKVEDKDGKLTLKVVLDKEWEKELKQTLNIIAEGDHPPDNHPVVPEKDEQLPEDDWTEAEIEDETWDHEYHIRTNNPDPAHCLECSKRTIQHPPTYN